MPSPTLAAATAEARKIFSVGGLSSVWNICEVRPEAEKPGHSVCAGPLEVNEIAVRVVGEQRPRSTSKPLPDVLGYCVLSAERHGSLATVLFSPIRSLASRTAEHLSALIGRVMAHEVGHLLLGSTDHGRTGLMRAVWNLDQTRQDESSWYFSPEEIERIRARLRRESSGAGTISQ